MQTIPNNLINHNSLQQLKMFKSRTLKIKINTSKQLKQNKPEIKKAEVNNHKQHN